jgi:hypothetical protein
VKHLQTSYDLGFGYAAWIRGDSDLKNILDDPRVDAILEKMDDRMADETA